MSDVIDDYILLLNQFANGFISVEKFRKMYFYKFKNETGGMSDQLFQILEELFGDVDSFTTDPELLAGNSTYYLNESTLREKVGCTLRHLTQLGKAP